MRYLTVVPAYGRDYVSQAAVKKDWHANLDFRIQDISAKGNDGRYINKADLEKYEPGTTVNIRYNQLRRVLPIPPGKPS